MTSLIRLLRDRRGATAVEYALIASLISVAGIVAFNNVGSKSQAKFEQVDNRL